MSKKKPKQKNKLNFLFFDQKGRRSIILMSLLVLVIKLFVIMALPEHAWPGADARSYLLGTNAIIENGIFTKNSLLLYFPAGYSIIVWLFSRITATNVLMVIAIIQSITFFFSAVFFAEKIRQTRLTKMAFALAFILAVNPTLSLSSMVVGYENLAASFFLLSIGLIIHTQLNPSNKTLWKTLPLVAGLQSISAFMQPRLLLISFSLFLIWGLRFTSRKTGTLILVFGIAITLILPAGEVIRNIKANDMAVISTNLGTTMNIGVGDHATGGYQSTINKIVGVPCDPKPSAKIVSDGQRITCVLGWYVANPIRTLHLSLNKSIYFWSPWYGPLAEGTMARNPWVKVNPIRNIAQSSPGGYKLVYGWVGKTISWLWLLGGLTLMFIGFVWIWRKGELERLIAILALTPVILAWVTSIGTIGDHRFRVPTMGVSLFLQVAGAIALKIKFMKTVGLSALEPKASAR